MKESNFQKQEVNNFLSHLKKNEKWIEKFGYKYPQINESEIIFSNYVYQVWQIIAKLLERLINSSNTIRACCKEVI